MAENSARHHTEADMEPGRNGTAGVGDSALASYLVDPTKHLPHRLEQVAREYLHVGLQPIRGLLGSGKQRKERADLTVDKWKGSWQQDVTRLVEGSSYRSAA